MQFRRVLDLAPDPGLLFTLAAPLNDDELPDVVAINETGEGLVGGSVSVLLNVSTLAPPCIADLDGSGVVDFGDVIPCLQDWGECEDCPCDLNGDGVIDFADIIIVLQNWGPCP